MCNQALTVYRLKDDAGQFMLTARKRLILVLMSLNVVCIQGLLLTYAEKEPDYEI
jgi:hypothetical protein